jgi:phosphoesterase RecJ-like protein
MDEVTIGKAKNKIREATKILVTSHQRPDGDAIGSVLGFGLALGDAGKEVQMVLVDGAPKIFKHLKGFDQILKKPEGDYDISMVLDCSDIQRVGKIFDDHEVPTLNIDHHVTNLYFGKINIVYPNIPATAEMLFEIIPSLGLSITRPVAEALLTGIVTDTLGFRTSNMKPKTMRTVADLMEIGCDLPDLYQKVLTNKSFEAARFWGAGLRTLQKDDRLVWATLTQEDRKEIGYPGRDDADLINVLSSIDAMDIAIIFVEQPNGSVKVSWRAVKGVDVSKIAVSFGGGGHQPAAGAEITGSLSYVRTEVLNRTRNYLMENLLVPSD